MALTLTESQAVAEMADHTLGTRELYKNIYIKNNFDLLR